MNIPTRVTASNATLLDVCVSSTTYVTSSGIITYSLSDHYLLICVKKRRRNDSNISRHKVKVRSFKDYDVDAMQRSLSQFNWGRYYATKDVNVCWSILYDQIKTQADFFAPFCTKFVRTAQPGWFSTELLEKSIDRDRLFGIAMRSKKESDFINAKAKRNEIKTDIQNAQSSYYLDRLARFSGDEVNTLISPVNTKKINCIYDFSNDRLADPETSAGLINNFFAGVGQKLDNDLPKSPFVNIYRQTDLEFTCTNSVSVQLVLDLIGDIDVSKSSGCMMISSRIYKDALEVLVEQLTYLFNLSLTTGVFPSAWKACVITPIPKKGDCTLLNDIRPITQTHICGKILEKIAILVSLTT